MKTTDWFPADVRPAHVGYYEVCYADDATGTEFLYWSGERWQYKENLEQAPLWGFSREESWRGLAKGAHQ